MTDVHTPGKAVSLGDLLKINKERFDRIYQQQREELGLMHATHFPVTADQVAPAAERRPPVSSEVALSLNKAFGEAWSYEIAEHRIENGLATVLCRMTANGTTKMQIGTARVNGDPGLALDRATQEALRKCAEMFDVRIGVPSPAPAPEPERAPAATRPAQIQASVPAAGTARAARATDAALLRQVPAAGTGLDPITLDLIENALRNARHEMDAVLFRSAMSPVIREQHDEFPMITDHKGRMIVGQFGSYIAEMLRNNPIELNSGDVILQSDPFKCGGAISHVNDWMVLVPVFYEDELMGFTSMFGHMMDVGGPVAGSVPTAATSIFGEGIKIPPVKVYQKGQVNQAVLDLIMNNTRTPEMNYSDLMAIIAGCRAGEKRVLEICRRFGKNLYRQACDALLDRTNRAMRKLIVQNLPEEPQFFEDYVDDDGCGNGPFKMKLTVWREGEHAYFDWTGTSPQAKGPINFYLHEGMFKMFIGVYMIMVFDPQILFNDGFYDLIHVSMPKGSLLNPNFPAPLGCRTHTLSRQFDVLGGALSKNAPEMATAAGYGSSPYFFYTGTDRNGRYFQLMEISFGGIPGRPIGDGMDGHAWWPLFENIPTEYLESYYPLIVEKYTTVADSGGAGKHRGGNGIEKVYLLLEDGEISIHDDRHRTHPWGILGGMPGACSEKWLVHQDGKREPLPSKVDNVAVRAGDRVVFRTAGGGGWGDPLERDPARVRNDVARHLLTAAKAEQDFGVKLTGSPLRLEQRATEELRENLKRSRKTRPLFDFGERPGDNGPQHAV